MEAPKGILEVIDREAYSLFTTTKKQWALGRRIYGYHSWREKRRITLFVLRSFKNKKQLQQLQAYFKAYKPLPNLLEVHEGIYEIINRIFLYKDSTAAQRLAAIEDHFNMAPEYFKDSAMKTMYDPKDDRGVTVWESEELNMRASLWFHTGQRKEGFLSLFLFFGEHGLYHINFRLGHDFEGQPCIWVGTIQGYKEGLNKAKAATKKMFGYRPKNFMFFLLRQVATAMGIDRIYAVSDKGFYTNTHLIRGNRSKKVQFDSFWQEMGGAECHEDDRFYRIPLEEERKTYETAKTHKRNMYRKRYEMLDRYIDEIQENAAGYLLTVHKPEKPAGGAETPSFDGPETANKPLHDDSAK